MQPEGKSPAPLTPLFETSTKESFTYRELRANFHIVNSNALWVSLVDLDGQASAEFVMEQSYEGEAVHTSNTLDGTPETPPTETPPSDPPGPMESPSPGMMDAAGTGASPPLDAASLAQRFVTKPARTKKLPLALLRGRNMLRLTSLDDPGAVFTFPMFYKTPTRDWAESILKALIILVLIQFFVIQTFFIPTGSMKNTLMEKDFIMVEKVSYLFGEPERGDVVVFQYPEDPRKDFIKRMVAREADRVEVNRKKLLINGHELDEPYVALLDGHGVRETVHRFQYDRDFYGPHPVPDRSIFVMGDNRNNSLDSRMWGPLPLYRMKGKAFLVYWPMRRFGLIKHEHRPFSGVDTPKATPPER